MRTFSLLGDNSKKRTGTFLTGGTRDISNLHQHSRNCSEAKQKVNKVIELIRGDPLSNVPADTLAQQAGLSTSQMNRWFKRFTGVPVRRYRLWHRLFVTANLMAFGKTLTEAAHTAGFSDSSHLNHTFRSMLGMTPSFVFQRSERLRIFSSDDV